MKKFTIYTDNKSMTYSYELIEANDIVEAMEIADKMWNENVYLMRIMTKVGKIEKEEDYKVERYEATLCRRNFGWYKNDKNHYETTHVAKHCIAKYGDWFEII